MENPALPRLWVWCVFPAVTMSLGWGLRGYIGGGPLGAMIPGAMVGMALCLLLGREHEASLVAAFAAVGVGLGGQETYGQTVHISMLPGLWAWGMTGFTVKGAVWGLAGGAAMGIAFTRARFSTNRILAGLLLMIVGTWAGWKLVNQPKAIYFSYLLDKPREELWAGLLAGGLLLAACAGTRLVWRFALWGALGGGLGFGIGAAIHIWGRVNQHAFPIDWWKVMEFVFGALLGGAYGYCAWLNRAELTATAEGDQPRGPLWLGLLGASAGIALMAIVYVERVPLRFDYTIIGSCLLAGALIWRVFRWQTAITITYCAFAVDFLENRNDLRQDVLWAFVVLTSAATALFASRFQRVRPQFVYLTVTAVLMAQFKGLLLRQDVLRLNSIITFLTFIVMGVVALVFMARLKSVHFAEVVPSKEDFLKS